MLQAEAVALRPRHHVANAAVACCSAAVYWPPTEGESPPGQSPPDVELLGHDGGTFLVVRENGSVVSVQPSADPAERFVNSSRDRFIDSLERLRDAWEARAALSEERAVRQARELRNDVAARDEAAVSNEDHWWSLVLEQLEDGLL